MNEDASLAQDLRSVLDAMVDDATAQDDQVDGERGAPSRRDGREHGHWDSETESDHVGQTYGCGW